MTYKETYDEALAAIKLIPNDDDRGIFVLPYIKQLLSFYNKQMFVFKKPAPDDNDILKNSMFILRSDIDADDVSAAVDSMKRIKLIRLINDELVITLDYYNKDGNLLSIRESKFEEIDKHWYIPFSVMLKYMLTYPQ